VSKTKTKARRITDEQPPVAAPEPNGKQEAEQRRKDCTEEIESVLRKHNCQMRVILNPYLEPVGHGGDKGIVSVIGINIEALPPRG